MNDKILLITKDALCKSYLPVYGNKYWEMPNLQILAKKGTVWDRYYTAAPSTAMSFISMFTGNYPYQTAHRKYVPLVVKEKNTMFDILYERGYSSHIIWDEKWVKMAKRYSECYGKYSEFHYVKMNQTVGSAHFYGETLNVNDDLAKETIDLIEKEISKIDSSNNKYFLWIHIPHVILGRTGYGTDMDVFDDIIGVCRKYFEDESIYISADHGNMNANKGKICYGFDVYEPAICIPLITPKVNSLSRCNQLTCNVHLYNILQGEVPCDEFVLSDCAYYAQPHRKLAIIHDRYKYIYNKKTKTEELYDIVYDTNENCNLLNKVVYDCDRKVKTRINEVYYYPYWDKINAEYHLLRNKFDQVWRSENVWEGMRAKVHRIGVTIINKYRQIKNRVKRDSFSPDNIL